MAVPAESLAVKWVTASVGVPAALYAVGYMIDHGQQDLFGVTISAVASTTYLISSGRFFLDLMAAFSMQLIPIAVVLVVVAAICALASRGLRWVTERTDGLVYLPQHHLCILAGLLLVVAHFVLVAYYVLPVIALRNILYQIIDLRHSSELLRTIVCARETIAGCPNPVPHYERILHLRCLLHVSLAVAATVLSIRIVTAPLSNRARLEPLVRGIVALLAVVNVLAVPFAYGKTLRRMPVKEVIIVHDQDGARESSHGLMLSESSDEVVFLDKDTRIIWQVPRKAIQVIRVEQIEDLLTVHARNSQESVPITPPG